MAKKTVTFTSNEPVVYFIDPDSASRSGLCWIQAAIDRQRFQRRADELSLKFIRPMTSNEEFRKAFLSDNLNSLRQKISPDKFAGYLPITIITIDPTNIEKCIDRFRHILDKYLLEEKEQIHAIDGLSHFVATRGDLRSRLPKILYMFYEKDIFDEDALLTWYKKTHPSQATCLAFPFIRWLEEAEAEN